MEKQATIAQSMSLQSQQGTEAELKMAVLATSSNIPLAFHDRLSPAIRTYFHDSKTAVAYHSASTKATCMINGAVAPSFINSLTEQMKIQSIDGSNDNELEKMNPVTIRIYDLNHNKVTTDMCTCPSSTAEALFNTFDTRLSSLLDASNPWLNCTSCGVDNTSVNIGTRNSIKTRVLKKMVPFSLMAYRAIIKHVSTRWLSLELAIDRSLRQYTSLKSYFLCNDHSQARFQRLKTYLKVHYLRHICYFIKLFCLPSHMLTCFYKGKSL